MSISTKTLDDAVTAAKIAFDGTDKHPFGHGFAHMELDGRTSLAKAMKAHPDVSADNSDYVTVDGVNRYLAAQKAAYSAFCDVLDDAGIETDITIAGRLD